MKDFAPSTMWGIAGELLGAVPLWICVWTAALFLLLFVIALVRRRGFHGAAGRMGVYAGLIVSVIAVLFAPLMTQAAFTNLHGVVDWIALAVFGLLVFAATVVAVYGVLGLGGRA